jgi:hypothetical protein
VSFEFETALPALLVGFMFVTQSWVWWGLFTMYFVHACRPNREVSR